MSARRERLGEIIWLLDQSGILKFSQLCEMLAFKYGTSEEAVLDYLRELKATGRVKYAENHTGDKDVGIESLEKLFVLDPKVIRILSNQVKWEIVRLLDSGPMDAELVSSMLYGRHVTERPLSRQAVENHLHQLAKIGVVMKKKVDGKGIMWSSNFTFEEMQQIRSLVEKERKLEAERLRLDQG